MEKDKEITDVIFRKHKKDGDIIAVFPYIIERGYDVMCYQHVGQHSVCDYEWFITECKPTTEEEYKSLMIELENLGYNLNILQKRNYGKYLNSFKKL
jgi:hypothetical protein